MADNINGNTIGEQDRSENIEKGEQAKQGKWTTERGGGARKYVGRECRKRSELNYSCVRNDRKTKRN